MERWQTWLDKSQLLDSRSPWLRKVKVWDRQSQMRCGYVNRDGVVVWGKTVSYWQDYWPHMLMPPTWVISYRFAILRFAMRIPFGNKRKPMWMRGRDPWRLKGA